MRLKQQIEWLESRISRNKTTLSYLEPRGKNARATREGIAAMEAILTTLRKVNKGLPFTPFVEALEEIKKAREGK